MTLDWNIVWQHRADEAPAHRFRQRMQVASTSSTEGTSISRTSVVRTLSFTVCSGVSGRTSILVAGAEAARIFWMRAMVGS